MVAITPILEESGEYLRRALAITRAKLGPRHQYVGISLHNLGNLAFSAQDYAQALDYQVQALHLFEQVLSAEHAYVGYALSAIGEIRLAEGKAKLAVAPLRRALSIRSAPGTDPLAQGQTEFLLAQALLLPRASAVLRDEALALARSAEQRFQSVGEGAREDLEAVEAWLAKA